MNTLCLRRGVPLVVMVVLLGLGCASMRTVEQHTSQGPSAREMWTLRMIVQNGREPTLDERIEWENQLDSRITQYLNMHPDAANSLQVTSFRFDRRTMVGMSKEQVLLLLDAPMSVTGAEADMEKLARRFWPQLKGNVTEAWVYPLGWNLYFAGPRLADITQYDDGK